MLRLFVGALVKLLRATIKFVMSACPSARKNLVPTGWIFVDLVCESLSETCGENSNFITIGQLIRVLYMKTDMIFIISPSVFRRRKNVSDEIYGENQNTRFTHIFMPFVKNVELYVIAGQITGEKIVGRMLFTCCITKAIETQPEYVLLIAFPCQNCLRKLSPVFLNTYIFCLVAYSYRWS